MIAIGFILEILGAIFIEVIFYGLVCEPFRFIGKLFGVKNDVETKVERRAERRRKNKIEKRKINA